MPFHSPSIAFYICFLLIWSGVYFSFYNNLNPIKCFCDIKCTNYLRWKYILIVILFISYCLQFTISIYISSRNKLYDEIRFYMIIIIIFFVSFITFFTIYYTCYLKFFLDKNFIKRKIYT